MSSNLALSQVAAAQAQKEVTINDAFGQVDAALTEFLAVDLSAGDVTLTAAQAQRAMLLRAGGNAVARGLTLPQIKRGVTVQNTGSAALTVKRGTTTVAIDPGAVASVYLDGTANGLVVTGRPGGAGGIVPIEQGGTGATTAPAALVALGALAKAGDTLAGDLQTSAGVRISTGGPAQVGISGVTADIQSNSTTAAGLAAARWSADPSPPRLMLAKSYGGAVGTHAAVPSGVTLGEASFAASSGTGMVSGAALDAVTQAAATGSGVATALRLLTSSGAALVERMRLDNLGNLQMGGTNTVIDAQRIPRLRSYTQATLPAPSSAPQGVVDCSDLGGGAGPLYSDGTTWQRLQELSSYGATGADANATLSVLGNASVIAFTANLTADRTVTLSTTGAYLGAMKRVIYAGSGAGKLVCGGITLRPGCWADFMWTGAAWTCVAAGVRNDAMQVYETGTWSPTLFGNTTPGTQTMHANNSGNYIRAGQVVVAVAYVQWSAIDAAAAGDVVIGGLPFPAANLANNLPTAAVTGQTVTYPAGQTQLIARFRGPNGTTVSLIFSGPGTGQAFAQMSQLSAAGVLSFTIVYRTN
ncbi:hypothetical protein [Inquilinus limosus]|uniref:Tail fiber protein n=1 Tax=Inquilinus limosus MP06 TaxID=1398085 RepID=A0A0A0D9G7_9PROT|nr:hypothetical protein [Inquilinus limosus]KGM34769.1 hypothetical protein P409_08375 [Inquilinus limosus MP06]